LSESLSVLALRVLAFAVTHAGGDARALFAEVGVDPALLDREDARVPAERAFAAFERARAFVGDDAFALNGAAALPLGTMAALDFAVRSSGTMGEALARIIRYYGFVDDGTALHLETEGDIARLFGVRAVPPPPRAATEVLFALIVARGRSYTGETWPMREVAFVQSAPAEPRAHERFFGAKVRFGAARNELVFDARWLDVPCRTHDPDLGRYLDEQVGAMLARLSHPDTFLDDVRRAATDSIRGSSPMLEATARRLAMSARTLQRRLHELGTSHTKIVEEVREGLARQLLGDGRTSVSEVGFLLGFADASAFHHAFVRWTGVTPTAFREERQAHRAG
jgi:AraC-like DNA-binding protein